MTTMHKVTFPGGEATLTGNLFLPAGGTPALGIVVAGTWTSVKEMTADRYAQQLADRGYAALSFGFTGFGGSGGTPRDVEARRFRDLVRPALGPDSPEGAAVTPDEQTSIIAEVERAYPGHPPVADLPTIAQENVKAVARELTAENASPPPAPCAHR